MPAEQQELPLSRRKAAYAAGVAAEMISILDRDACWMTRAALRDRYNIGPRECRLARQYSRGKIIFGQRGYKATRHATHDEIARAANTLTSQAQVMAAEAQDLWKVFHGRKH